MNTVGASGTVILNTDNTVTYTPNAGFFGSDSFTFQVNDGLLDSNVATVSITIRPSAPADVVTIDEVVRSAGELEVFTFSTDPAATLTVVGFGVMQNLGDGEYVLMVSLVSSAPSTVTVTSDKGGSDTATVEID